MTTRNDARFSGKKETQGRDRTLPTTSRNYDTFLNHEDELELVPGDEGFCGSALNIKESEKFDVLVQSTQLLQESPGRRRDDLNLKLIPLNNTGNSTVSHKCPRSLEQSPNEHTELKQLCDESLKRPRKPPFSERKSPFSERKSPFSEFKSDKQIGNVVGDTGTSRLVLPRIESSQNKQFQPAVKERYTESKIIGNAQTNSYILIRNSYLSKIEVRYEKSPPSDCY